jgi:hypothetical protein
VALALSWVAMESMKSITTEVTEEVNFKRGNLKSFLLGVLGGELSFGFNFMMGSFLKSFLLGALGVLGGELCFGFQSMGSATLITSGGK